MAVEREHEIVFRFIPHHHGIMRNEAVDHAPRMTHTKFEDLATLYIDAECNALIHGIGKSSSYLLGNF